MKNILLIILSACFVFNMAFASDFNDYWLKGVEYCTVKNFELAEIEFNKAINDLESQKDKDHPYIYVDRARMFLYVNKYEEALKDVSIALSSENLILNDRIKALLTRISVYAHLKMQTELMKDVEEFHKIYPDSPTTEYSKDKIIIRNAPDSELYRSMITEYYVKSDMCESESDIQYLPSGIISIKLKSKDSNLTTDAPPLLPPSGEAAF